MYNINQLANQVLHAYRHLPSTDFQRLYDHWVNWYYKGIPFEGEIYNVPNSSLAHLECEVPCAPTPDACKKPPMKAAFKKDENPMSYAKAVNDNVAIAMVKADESDLVKARKRFSSRVEEIYHAKSLVLNKQFFIDGDETPRTLDEALQRIADGKVVKWDSEKQKKKGTSWSGYAWSEMLEWRSQPADQAGFDKAKDVLRAAREDTLDIVLTQDEKAGLEALTSFKAWTFSA